MNPHVTDPVAYEEGRAAYKLAGGDVRKMENRYPRLSPSWMSWNLGWNSYLDEPADPS